MTLFQRDKRSRQVALINNLLSGGADPASASAVDAFCVREGWTLEKIQFKGEADLERLAQDACAGGIDLLIAAGGDGTISAVVEGMVGGETPLAIYPMGTGNGLAQALGLPMDMKGFLELLSDAGRIQWMDVMRVGRRHAVLNVSAGISPRAMRMTEERDKKRSGLLAYALSFAKAVQEIDAQEFELRIDGEVLCVEASEVIVTNGSVFHEGVTDFYGGAEDLFDGQVEIYVMRPDSMDGYVRLAWEMLMRQNTSAKEMDVHIARKEIQIQTRGAPCLVQMDGDVVGETPVNIELLPKKLPLVVPAHLSEKA